jgi:hypothetical protein
MRLEDVPCFGFQLEAEYVRDEPEGPPLIYTVSPAATPEPEAELSDVQALAHEVPLFKPVAPLSTYHVAP